MHCNLSSHDDYKDSTSCVLSATTAMTAVPEVFLCLPLFNTLRGSVVKQRLLLRVQLERCCLRLALACSRLARLLLLVHGHLVHCLGTHDATTPAAVHLGEAVVEVGLDRLAELVESGLENKNREKTEIACE